VEQLEKLLQIREKHYILVLAWIIVDRFSKLFCWQIFNLSRYP